LSNGAFSHIFRNRRQRSAGVFSKPTVAGLSLGTYQLLSCVRLTRRYPVAQVKMLGVIAAMILQQNQPWRIFLQTESPQDLQFHSLDINGLKVNPSHTRFRKN
jgi:hypothetical protein